MKPRSLSVLRPLEGVSVAFDHSPTARSVVVSVYVSVECRARSVEVSVACDSCGQPLGLMQAQRDYDHVWWVDLDACDAAMSVTLTPWHGDGWDSVRSLVDELEADEERPAPC